MSFHEKSAWAMAGILIAGLCFYVSTVARMSVGLEGLAPPVLPVVVVYIIVIVGLSILGHILIAITRPSEADDTMDERDKLIAARAGNIAGVLLGLGILGGLAIYLFTYDGNQLFQTVFVSLRVAQIAEYGARIVYYRGGV